MHSPLCIQLHQLAHVKAELDIGDGAAGISLAASTGIRWHQQPGDRDTPCHLPATHPARLWHMATHWKCLMISEGSVISLGMWVTISVRATLGKRRGKGMCRMELQNIMLPSCPPSSELGHQLPPQRQVSTDLLNAQSQTLRAQPDNAISQTDGYSRTSVSRYKTRERERFASRLSLYPEAGENQPHLSLPSQFHAVPKNLCT